MPRAFLITHRRYNGVEEEFDASAGDYSPERAAARLVDYGNVHPTSDGASECGSETSSECPEELYNLTKLAEVSLAAAAGKLIHPNNVIYQRSTSPRFADPSDKCAKMSAKMKDHQQSHLQVAHRTSPFHEDQTLAEERRRFLFERIETERDIQRDNRTAMLDVRLSPHHHHHHHHHRHHHHHHHQPYRNPDESQVDVCGKKNSFVAENRIEVPSLTGSVVSNGPQSRKSAAGTVDNSKTDDNEDHECPDCGKKYSTSSNLARHRQTHRSLGDKKARRCPHCDKVYVSMPAFSMHVRTHNQGCKCHYCGKCFSRPWLLQGHIRTHTGEKPFKCTICNKAFADKSNLRAHIQTHSNTKPHVCGRCGKAFALKSYLYKHEESSCMRAHHRSTSEKNDSTDRKTTSSSSSSTSSKTNDTVSSSASTATGAANLQVNLSTPCVTASPTSVIVPRLALSNRNHQSCQPPSAFSAIIKHTAATAAAASECPSELAPASKRPCKESSTNSKEEKRKSINEYETKDTDIVSSMVIRTSVISPNPEHLGRFNSEVKKLSTFDYSDATRSSAFSRPPAMTLNLAIA